VKRIIKYWLFSIN